jgi:CheY-like chemotaxis protein
MAVLRGLALRRLIVCCRNESGVFSTGDRSTQTYYHSNDRQAPLRVGCDIVASKQASAGGHRESHREPRYFPNRAAPKAFTPVSTRGESMGQAFKPTALVVENDELQRSLVSALLEESNMNVIQCESAEAAVLILDQSGDCVSMVFTDVELAGSMDGIELASIAKARFPDLHVIVTSGVPRLRRLPDGTTFMAKPWSPIDVLIEAQKSIH